MANIERVSPAEMRQIAGTIQGKIEEWAQAVQKIFALQAELDAMWDGDANDEFNRQWEEDRTKYNTLQTVMTEYKDAIIQAANDYEAREDEITGIVKSK